MQRRWLAASIGVVGSLVACSLERPRADPVALLDAGRYAESEAAGRADYDARRAAYGPTAPASLDAADVLLQALIANGKGADPQAAALAKDTLAARERQHGADSPDIVVSLGNLSDVLVVAADYGPAIATATRAVTIRERAGADRGRDLTDALDHLGHALVAARRHDEALAVLRRCLALKEAAFGPTAAPVARTLEDMSLVWQRQASYAESGQAIRRAMAIQESIGREHPAYASTLNLLAQQLWFEGDILASREASERAVRQAE